MCANWLKRKKKKEKIVAVSRFIVRLFDRHFANSNYYNYLEPKKRHNEYFFDWRIFPTIAHTKKKKF